MPNTRKSRDKGKSPSSGPVAATPAGLVPHRLLDPVRFSAARPGQWVIRRDLGPKGYVYSLVQVSLVSEQTVFAYGGASWERSKGAGRKGNASQLVDPAPGPLKAICADSGQLKRLNALAEVQDRRMDLAIDYLGRTLPSVAKSMFAVELMLIGAELEAEGNGGVV